MKSRTGGPVYLSSTTGPKTYSRNPTTRERKTTSRDGSASRTMVRRQLGPSAESGRSVGRSLGLQQGSARAGFSLELQELQSEVTAMADRVGRALSQAADVILSGDLQLANEVIKADDQVDSTYVAVTEHCYDL